MSGGSAGTNGTGGSSPLPEVCPPNNTAAPVSKFISTFEGDEPLKVLVAPDGGSWIKETDGTGTISATVEDDPEQYGHALHFTGSNHTGWGGDFAVTFIAPSQAIDASSHQGITLFLSGTITNGTLYAKLQNPDSILLGCGCDPSPTAPAEKACYGGYLAEIPLVPQWREIDVAWVGFQAGPYGFHRANTIDRKNLLNLALVVQSNGLGPTSWDLWFDDVQFTGP